MSIPTFMSGAFHLHINQLVYSSNPGLGLKPDSSRNVDNFKLNTNMESFLTLRTQSPQTVSLHMT